MKPNWTLKHNVVGQFNLEQLGDYFDDDKVYIGVRIEEFDTDGKPTGRKKTFYFLKDNTHGIPDFDTEGEVRWIFSKKDGTKIKGRYRYVCR